MILIKSYDPKGGLYVETKNLDGETNLKNKFVQKDVNNLYTENNVKEIGGQIVCEKPNNAIYKFEGFMNTSSGKKISLGADNMILRGCKLRNTEWVIGITVFTGHDSKIMMNTAEAKYKFSSLEKASNKAILFVLLMQICLASISSAVGTSW